MRRFLALAATLLIALAPLPAAAQKDRLVVGTVLEPPHLDPTGSPAAAIDEVLYANVMEGLVRIDEKGAVKPQLAESWTVSPDGLVYSFRLKPGVVFHDGAPFDSAAVKFTVERAQAPGSVNPQKKMFEEIAAVETPAPSTAVIRLKQPDYLFLTVMGYGDSVMFSPQSAAKAKTDPVGTGPFRFVRWVKGDRIELAKFDRYRDAADVALKSVAFRFIGDPAAITAALLAGDVDAVPNGVPPENLPQFRADPRFSVEVGATEGETILAMNNRKKPFDDVRVRRAVSYALDRKAIIDGAMSGEAQPIGSHFSPLHPAYVDLTGLYPHDPAKAKALLAEAGHANGFSVTLKLPPPSYARRSGEIIAQQLGEVGIKVSIEPLQWAQWLSNVFTSKDYDMSIVAHTEPLDIEIYGRENYYFNYGSPKIAALWEQVKATSDEAGRNRLYGEMQRIVADDAVNGFLFQLPKTGVWNKNLTGLWKDAPIQANDLTAVRWTK
jgi:peptide/nickel transport system substrate-binding protein